MFIVEQKKRVVMRQISATMIFPFDDAKLAKKNRIIAIFHNKTHATILSSFINNG